jgi:thiamine pyrophosphokinase
LSNTEISRAVVVANGDVPVTSQFAGSLPKPGDGTLVVAADGGLHVAEQIGLRPDIVVGDGDSLSPGVLDRLRREGVEVQLHPPAKDASDTELALREALRRGAKEIVIVGALGGVRFEHALANVLLLSLPELAGCDVRLVDGRSTVRLLGDGQSLSLSVDDGELVSLLPLTERAEGVRTHGLRFPLDGEVLEQGTTRGLSNEIQAGAASVELGRGRLAVVQTRIGGGG